MLENFQQVSAWIESQQNTEWPNNRSGKKAKDLFDVLVAATTQAEVESAAKAFVDAVKGNYNAADLQTALAADIEAVQKAEAEAAEQERLEQEQAEKARAAQEA